MRFIRWLGLALVCAGAPALCAVAQEADPELPGEGSEAPSFALPVYNAEAAQVVRSGTMMLVGEDAQDQDVRLIVISFMASYCKPCKAELPVLQQLHERYKDRGLRIVGVAIDTEPAGQRVIVEMLKERKISFPVVRDQFNLVARNYLGSKIPLPSVFLVDPKGKVLLVSRGYSEEVSKKLLSAIERAIPAAGARVKAASP